ncbi:MAG TPA: hypothetical protein VGR47_02785 [Terracidiphilus sp.]|nr:hypothetical protein [Terracidiphilus sp.]
MADTITDPKARSGASRYRRHGLSLPRPVLNALRKRGIHCLPSVSLEHQHLANRYVLRGVESGGAVSDMGRACAFVAPDGSPLPWLQRIDSIGVNGRHAIYLAESLVRLEMLRTGRTCELAITLHTLSFLPGRKRPEIRSEVIFRGRDGNLPVELWKREHQPLRGNVAPVFYSRAGEVLNPPGQFEWAINILASVTCCLGCRHVHVGVAPGAAAAIAAVRETA